MGGTQRLAAVAAVSHARHYYNHTAPELQPTEPSAGNINFIFASATLCGVLVMVCAACWHRKPASDKPEDECRGVYTVSADSRLNQVQIELPGPPPAYETVVEGPMDHHHHHQQKDYSLQEVVTEPHSICHTSSVRDSDLPSYEAAVLLKDTKL